ncbi:MAG TPA: hypothetical protein VF111_13085 [Thermoanaerobaculia bacterium]
MSTLHDAAQQFVAKVAFDSPTLYKDDDQRPYNWYWYGQAQKVGPQNEWSLEPVPNQENPLTPFQPPAIALIGFPDNPEQPAPFCGSIVLKQFLSVTDCSGFVAYIVDQVHSTAFRSYERYALTMRQQLPALQQLDQKHGQHWPSAADWAFAGQIGGLPGEWMLVGNSSSGLEMANVQPGDILAWAATDSQDTGHVVIVDSVMPLTATSWMVNVLDASSVEHANDSRQNRGGTGTGGIQVSYDEGWQILFNTGDNPHTVDPIAVLRLTS